VEVLKRIPAQLAGIEASRALLPQVWIDEERCSRLVDCLDSYRKDWDEKLSVWKDQPVHDEFSHGYKAFESAAIRPQPRRIVDRPRTPRTSTLTASVRFTAGSGLPLSTRADLPKVRSGAQVMLHSDGGQHA